jgi:hypothetical protein
MTHPIESKFHPSRVEGDDAATLPRRGAPEHVGQEWRCRAEDVG